MQEAHVHIAAISLSATGEAEVKVQIVSGQVKPGMFLHIPLNGSFDVTTPIGAVREDANGAVLLVLDGGVEWAGLLIALNFVDEELRVTEDGEY